MEVVPEKFKVFVWKILQQWGESFAKIYSCTTLTLLPDIWLLSLKREVWGSILKSVQVLCYNFHVWYASNILIFFKIYRCSSSDQVNKRTPNLGPHLLTYKRRIKDVMSKNVLAKHWLKLILIQLLCLRSNCTAQIPQLELASTFGLRYQFHPTWLKNHFSLQF